MKNTPNQTRIKADQPCPLHRTNHEILVSKRGYQAWRNGMLIQHALPELSIDDRETLISGYCDEAWQFLSAE